MQRTAQGKRAQAHAHQQRPLSGVGQHQPQVVQDRRDVDVAAATLVFVVGFIDRADPRVREQAFDEPVAEAAPHRIEAAGNEHHGNTALGRIRLASRLDQVMTLQSGPVPVGAIASRLIREADGMQMRCCGHEKPSVTDVKAGRRLAMVSANHFVSESFPGLMSFGQCAGPAPSPYWRRPQRAAPGHVDDRQHGIEPADDRIGRRVVGEIGKKTEQGTVQSGASPVAGG